MAFVTKVLGKILGNKSERDIKEISPIVSQIKEEYKGRVNQTEAAYCRQD
jgi:preprotein translocase subunit SecA